MYQSPIELLFTDIHHQIIEQQEEQIYQAVLHFVPNVNREELIRALKYDRGQYDKGYAEGVADATPKWIPATEQMPEERKSAVPALGSYSRPVLVVWERKCTGDRFVREGYTREGKFVNKTYNDDIVPVAWMPMPEAPKEDKA